MWKHLVCVAVASRMIAARSGLQQFDEAYMCGLLHDIGILLLDQHLHKAFTEIASSISVETPTASTERELIGSGVVGRGYVAKQRRV